MVELSGHSIFGLFFSFVFIDFPYYQSIFGTRLGYELGYGNMAKGESTNRQYLELHRGKWRVTLAVPAALRSKLGTRLKRALGTDSLAIANAIKHGVLQELKDVIARAEGKSTTERNFVIREAERLRTHAILIEQQSSPEFRDAVAERFYEIRGNPISRREVGDGDDAVEIETYDPGREQLAAQFKHVALGSSIPFDLHLPTYRTEKLRVKKRTEDDLLRAIERLREWCVEQRIEENVATVSTRMAREFVRNLKIERKLAPRTVKKYVTRLNLYWRWLNYSYFCTENPWLQVEVDVEETPTEELERAFTNSEIARLLMGPAPQELRDAMMIGALSGARLDAIIDLKVGDTEGNYFIFKPQKKEKNRRRVPIHSALREIVNRRREGKNADDEFFPEYPRNTKDSLRERSFKTSNRFTTYRRSVGVDERVPGRRRSLVNFHSFRRWFMTRAEQAGVDTNLLSAMVGHKRGSITLDTYSEGPEGKRARLSIEFVKLPPLDGTPIIEPETLLIGKGAGTRSERKT